MNHKVIIFAIAVFINLVGLFAAEINVMHTQLIKTPPIIDGRIGEQEWRNAAQTFGSRSLGSINLEPRAILFYFGISGGNLYFACKSELPPKKMKLVSRVRKRDGRVYADDAVELIVMPPHANAVYQTIVNSIGTIFDKQYKVENGGITISKPVQWSPQTKVASQLVDGYWCLEIAIPLKDLGFNNVKPTGRWKVQMTRDWKQPTLWSSWNKSKRFCAPETMGDVVVSEQTPVLSFKGFGARVNAGKVNCRLVAYNPTDKPYTIATRMDITSITAPKALDEEQVVLPGKKIDFVLSFADKTQTRYDAKIVAKDNDTGKILFNDHLTWRPHSGPKWSKTSVTQTTLDFAFYPYRKIVKAGLNLAALKNKKHLKNILFWVSDSAGEVQVEQTVNINAALNEAEVMLQLPQLIEGNYRVHAKLIFSPPTKQFTFTRDFIYKKFPWEHNNIGKDDIIIPPFKPLQVDREQKTVFALMTGYRIKNGFWDAIYAQGENILTAPIKLVINNGKTIMKETSFEFIQLKDSEVITQTLLQSKNFALNIQQTYDYDGMCKLEMTLRPKVDNYTIKSAYIELPLKADVAKLMHAVNNNMRYNPAQYIPDGKNVVWDSRQAKENPKVAGSFMPYLWLGYVFKGLSWFSASDKNWSVDRQKPALEIIRQDDSVILRINIINQPLTLTKPVTYVMGFQPTPVKPRMKGWRKLNERWKPKGVAHALKMVTFAGNGTYGCQYEAMPWPMNHDYSIVNLISKQRRQEAVAPRIAEGGKFMEKHFSTSRQREYDFMDRHIKRGIRWSKDCDYAIPYINIRASSLKWQNYQVYMDEWWGAEYRSNMDGGYNNTFSASNQDMRLYYAQKLVQAGMDGLYYDNVRDWPIFDPIRGPAYKLPDGKTQPYFDIFELREFLKRTAVMLYLNKKTLPDGRPLLMVHMTNTNLIPFMSFCAISLDMEAWYGASDFQTRFSEGYILTESMGTQTGCIPQILVKITGKDRLRVSRTFIATALAFDLPLVLNSGGLDYWLWPKLKTMIMKFGYSTDAVKVYPCWKPQNYTKVLSTGIKSALYLKKGQAMLVISNFSDKSNLAKIDISGLGYKLSKISDAETGKELIAVNNIISMELEKHDFKLLLIKNN